MPRKLFDAYAWKERGVGSAIHHVGRQKLEVRATKFTFLPVGGKAFSGVRIGWMIAAILRCAATQSCLLVELVVANGVEVECQCGSSLLWSAHP